MKKIILSAAVAAMAFSTSAMAADKGIDIVTTGQAAVYYQTEDSSEFGEKDSLMSSDSSSANVGLQLNLNADLKNNFTFGSQLTYLGTAGLERTVVDGVRQGVTSGLGDTDTRNDIALTKIFVAKKIANTTVKLGRQELPKSLSPLAFSEGWNVFKNTFDAIVAVNTDIPNTTLVGAYVSSVTNAATEGDMGAHYNSGGVARSVAALGGAFAGVTDSKLDVDGAAYMLTAQTTAIPMTTLTASYYNIKEVNLYIDSTTPGTWNDDPTGSFSADAWWLDAQIADKSLPMGLKIGLQVGNLDPKTENADTDAVLALLDTKMDDTTAYGMKVSAAPVDALTLSAAYTSVDGNDNGKLNLGIRNVGGTKTPLYTQMVANQGMINTAADTLVLKAGYNMGDMGSISLAYGMTDDESFVEAGEKAEDYNELDLVYKIKAGGVQYFAAYVHQDFDGANDDTVGGNDENYDNKIVRLWARYNF